MSCQDVESLLSPKDYVPRVPHAKVFGNYQAQH